MIPLWYIMTRPAPCSLSSTDRQQTLDISTHLALSQDYMRSRYDLKRID